MAKVQDDKRERAMRATFNLDEGEGRGGTDAFLSTERGRISFELKSTTGKSYSTVRDFGPDHAAKWRRHHWLFSQFDPAGDKMLATHYLSPDDMEPWIAEMEAYVLPDFRLAERVPELLTYTDLHAIVGEKAMYTLGDAQRLHKKQYTVAQYRERMDLKDGFSPVTMLDILRDRCRYVLERGATLNNPHINVSYVQKSGTAVDIGGGAASSLRALIAKRA